MTKKNLGKAFLTVAFCVQVGMQIVEAQTSLDTVKVTKSGNAQAQFESGKSKLVRKGAKNKEQAIKLFESAANRGHSRAAFYAAVMFERGLGTRRNIDKAIGFYLRAANAGNAEAMFTLSKMYDKGFGRLAKDKRKSQKWYNKAISQWRDGATGETILRH